MTAKFIFVGDRAQTPTQQFTHFGQEVEMPLAEAEELILSQNFPLIPAEKFAPAVPPDEKTGRYSEEVKFESRKALAAHRAALLEMAPEELAK